VTVTDPHRQPVKSSAEAARGALCLALGLALATGGCVSAGLAAAGPLFGAIQAVVDRSVDRTFPADLGTAWGATADALSRMGLRLHDVDRSGEAWTVEGKGDAVTLTARLERVTPQLTRVSLRAENGGLTADKKTADEILNQVAISLAPVTAKSPGGNEDRAASAEAISSLRREVERLGSTLEQRDSRASATPQPAPATFETGRIFVVPASAGVPSAPMPEDMSLPARAGTIEDLRAPARVESKTVDTREVFDQKAHIAGADGTAPLLSPVESLTPVGALTGKGSAK